MHNRKSLRELIYKDLERKYKYVPQNIPKNQIHLFLILLKYIIGSKGFRSVFLYRLIYQYKNVQILKLFFICIRCISFNVDIPPTVKIGEKFMIGHPECVVIHSSSVIGNNVTIAQGVTLGGTTGKTRFGRTAPIIGDNVFIGAGAKILGPITIGTNSIIGANAVVVNDIPNNSVAVGIPAKVIKKIEKNYVKIENDYKKSLLDNI